MSLAYLTHEPDELPLLCTRCYESISEQCAIDHAELCACCHAEIVQDRADAAWDVSAKRGIAIGRKILKSRILKTVRKIAVKQTTERLK